MGVKYMKTSELVACICKSLTYGFLGFRTIENREMKLQIETSYVSMKTSLKIENIPHTNMIQDPFEIEANVMETSDSMTWEYCKLFAHEFLGFRPIYDMEMIFQSNT